MESFVSAEMGDKPEASGMSKSPCQRHLDVLREKRDTWETRELLDQLDVEKNRRNSPNLCTKKWWQQEERGFTEYNFSRFNLGNPKNVRKYV